MTTTDYVNTDGDKAIVYPVPVIWLGAAGGGIPTSEDASTSLIPVRIVQAAGGKRLDYVDIAIPLSAHMVDRVQPANFTRVIDVRLPLADDEWPEATGVSVHLGDYVQETEQVSKDGETLTAQSQVRGWHFGETIQGMLVWNQHSAENKWMHTDVMFNPVIDKKVMGNQSSKQRGGGFTSYLWAHPETSLTSASTTWQTQSLSEWTLLNAVQALVDACNPNETFIRNPETGDYAVFSGGPSLHDVKLKRGEYLPDLLDKLLPPLGFNWFLAYDEDPENEGQTKPQLKFFKRFEGTEKQLYFQAPGPTVALDLELSNVNQYSVTRSISDCINEVEVMGDFIAREITLPLYPIWPSADDGITRSALDKSDPESSYNTAGKELVWRAWAANEAGDYTGLRADALAAGTPPNLSSVFGTWIAHRRTIEEPITYLGSGKERRTFHLEYSTDGGATWQLCKDSFGAKLMPNQIGILFDGDLPPEEIMDAGTDARLRITGLVRGDSRIRGYAPRLSHSVNARSSRMSLTLEDKFQDRQVQTTGTYASVLSGSADERVDTDEIEDYAEEIRDRNNGAEVDAEIRIPGICLEYEIGDLITEIDGRNISLNRASDEDPTPRYPQVVERRFEYTDKGPVTTLVLDRGD
jgi:hypothetical protein